MKPHYYLMKAKKILRLEEEFFFESLPQYVRDSILDQGCCRGLDQGQANWRVVIFRDEIMEYDEYVEWLASPEANLYVHDEEENELDLIAN